MIRVCKHCNGEFENINGKVFSNHVRWCQKNPKQNDPYSITKGMLRHYNEIYGCEKEFSVNCHKCGKHIFVREREKQHPLKEKYFCNRSCANSHDVTEEQRNKVSKKLSGRIVSKRQKRICLFCNGSFDVTKVSKRKFCNMDCKQSFFKSDNEFFNYKRSCQFKFNLWKYPEEFDLDLIKKHGWYQAFNRGNNLGGVSRDHKISIKYGWTNKIPPEIMSHPANCKLMVHRDNISKHSKCSISVEELQKNIDNWNKKYS